MKNTAKALYRFFSSFGIPAFTEYDVPDEFPDVHGVMQKVVPPYITYQVIEPNWRDKMSMYARVWYRDTSYTAINAKVDQIKAAFFQDGADNCVSIPTPGGAIYLSDIDPQNMPMDGDDTLKVVYLNLSIQATST